MTNKWWMEHGPKGDVVLSSRIRLARNVRGIPFPQQQKNEAVKELESRIRKALPELQWCSLEGLSKADCLSLVERHLISPEFANKQGPRGCLISEDDSVGIMLQEEDHIRIQCIAPGFQLKEAYGRANALDDRLEEVLEYAFDERLGYLTACPSNVGTGLRASVMLHLPALCQSGRMAETVRAMGKLGIAVRGLYGEGSEAIGDMVQISNQVTLGLTEEEAIQNVEKMTEMLVEQELNLRREWAEKDISSLADRLWRSYGVLKYAQLLSSKEMMKLFSDLRLGIYLGILPQVKPETLNRLEVELQTGGILQKFGADLSPQKRDFQRAKLVREGM